MMNRIVTREQWLTFRIDLLCKEKELTAMREKLTEERRQLPWTKLEKLYTFDTQDGSATLSDLFDGRTQLIVYHFMFHPDWEEGCKSCSLIADHYDPAIVHLNDRDVSMVTVSRAPLAKLQAFRKRMGWSFKWVSSHGNDFNRDFNVTFTEEELQNRAANYNFEFKPFPLTEAPGISVFAKDEAGQIYHTYSSYARGLETFMGVYHLLDVVPKGRNESGDAYTMQWVRHHDRYGASDPFETIMGGRS
jgi:predicted dithiol-disulfide oxidoreductase (DUF899 family)